jgi:hypothetical protein
MPPPTWTVGEVLAAADVNAWFVPLVAVKTGDTSRTSTTTLAADPDLSIAVPTAGTWALHAYWNYEGGTMNASDLKTQLVFAAGTLRYHYVFQGPGGSANVGSTYSGGSTVALATQGALALCGATVNGTIVTATSGTLTLNWVQNTSSGTATVMHAQSAMHLQRIS